MYRKKLTGILCLLLTCMLVSSCGIITVNTKDPTLTTDADVTTSAPDTETDPPETVESAEPPVAIPEPKDWEIRREEAERLLDGQIDISFNDKILLISQIIVINNRSKEMMLFFIVNDLHHILQELFAIILVPRIISLINRNYKAFVRFRKIDNI